MASDVGSLLHDVLAFMQQLLGLPQLPADARHTLLGLVARLQRAEHEADGTYRASYLDMKSALALRKLHSALDAALQSGADDVDSNRWWTTAPPSEGQGRDSGATSADCSECLEYSADDWPPRGAPSCPRPDLSPDWAVGAEEARGLALHCGTVFRGNPGRWLRALRRGWAALLPAPARLLVFSGARSSRPRLVLALAPAVPAVATATATARCSDQCCAVYTARPRPRGPAFELCCPGRKTHQLWVSDEKEAQAWVEAVRVAAQPRSSSATTPRDDAAADCAPDADASARSTSRSRSESRSASVLSDRQRTPADSQAASAAVPEGELLPLAPAPPITPPPAPPSPPDQGDQLQQYESMLPEDIYHDIAPPGPSYANVGATAAAALADGRTRPHYDDVAVPPKPLYCNLQPRQGAGETEEESTEAGLGEHLYDDIGLRPADTRASVYELIQDPTVGQGIRCS